MVVDDKHKERCLLVFDFDKTLTDFDAGERLVSELAPELLPWLAGLQQPANFVPITNEVLQEMARRGVSRDKLLTQLQLLGSEMPPASVRMLRWAAQQGLPVRVLSDCNQVFISHMLSGAKLGGIFRDAQSKFEVITNAAAFERIAAAQAADAGIGLGVFGRRKAPAAAAKSPSHRLVIQPRHPESSSPHNCPRCPSNLCKGAELRRLRFGASSTNHDAQQLCSGSYGRIVYAGDGANDICPALSLGPNDVVLARAGEALAMYAVAAAQDSSVQQLAAPVYVWNTHEELAQLVREHAQTSSS
ncbi:putative phosphatase-domain-containing protein [Scenedesmus sp. NREL 46B-D3]|nr:putative phosphatase-domain-containing protein [Scenedesmus sp. NREL 46B-D3]